MAELARGGGSLVPAHDGCPVEFDLIAFRGTKLTFGDRARPLCTEATRPKTLSVWRSPSITSSRSR